MYFIDFNLSYDGMNENVPIGSQAEMHSTNQWNSLQSIMRCCLVGGSVSLGFDFEVSKALARTNLFLPLPASCQSDVSFQLLLPDTCLPRK